MHKRSLYAIVVAIALAPFAGAGEKPIPPQDVLDSCFAGGFRMESQMERTYTAPELAALDRALAAWDMTRHDLEFRKDYTEAHGAFPLILDMMKRPLQIAPYMDGFVASIDALAGEKGVAVPEVMAAALAHPGMAARLLPTRSELETLSLRDPRGLPRIPEPFRTLLRHFDLADEHLRRGTRGLAEDEVRILRRNLPKLVSWHDVVPSPYAEDETKRLDALVEGAKSDTYLHELAGKIDLQEMLLAWSLLPSPEDLRLVLAGAEYPKGRPRVWETPWGRMAVGTTGNDTYTGDYAILIEPGGDDVYRDCRIGAAWGSLGFLADLGGRDRYECAGASVTLGAAVLGVAAFYDLGGANDSYEGGHLALGAAAGGIASFVDDGGADRYAMKVFGEGAAGWGIGVMADRAPAPDGEAGSPANREDEEVDEKAIGNDRYEAWLMGQGVSRPWGIGVCHGSRGNDVYHAGGVYLHAPLFNDRYQSFSQGFSIGDRNVDYAGGLAFLIDDGGNDYYLGDIYDQGVGYWYAGGFLVDRGGNDHYEMTQYGQGSGIHLAVGGVIDESGNDSYVMNSGLGQGGSHDFAASVMMDRGGMDRYMGSTSSNGCGLTNAVGLFFDRSGNDLYGGDPGGQILGGGRWDRGTGSIGVFVDTEGTDRYVGKAADDSLWTQNLFGAGLDVKPEVAATESSGTTAQADRPPDESKVDIPEVCTYEGPLTDEVFKDLWAIAVRWEVGDNRVIVPKARERLVAFGIEVLPKLDGRFDDTSGLAGRAYESVLTAIGKDHPKEAREMLVRNLRAGNVARRRNALATIGSLKWKDLGPDLLPLLEDEKVRVLAIQTLGAIGSDAGNARLRAFLAPGQGERLILGAAGTLLQLGVTDVYPELRALLDHEFFTVREGIVSLLAQNRERFGERVLEDLRAPATGRRTRIGLLKVAGGYGPFPPSTPLWRAVDRRLASDDAVERAFAVKALRKWLAFEGKEWKPLQAEIRKRLDALRKTEPDAWVKGLLAEGGS